MYKHTKGQWVAKHAADGSKEIGIVADGGCIAECFHAIRSPNEGAHEECEANARLITTSPELLEALQAAETLFACHCKDSTALVWLENTRALIARATAS